MTASPSPTDGPARFRTTGHRVAGDALDEHLGPSLQALGLTRVRSRAHLAYGGTVRGRDVQVSCSIRTRNRFTGVGNASYRVYQGIVLQVRVSTPLQTRLASRPMRSGCLGQLGGRVMRWMGMEPVEGVALGSNADREAYAADPGWARSLLAGAAARGALDRLLAEGREVAVWPGSSSLLVWVDHPATVAGSLGASLEALIDLLEAAESLPPPPAVERTWLERISEDDPDRATLIIVVALLFGLPLLLAAGTATIMIVLLAIGGTRLLAISLILFAAIFMPFAMGIALWLRIKSLRDRAKKAPPS